MEPVDPETSPTDDAVPAYPAPESGPGADPASHPALDPVDLALLMKPSPERSAARVAARRYVSLVVVVIVFVVLVIMGLLMVAHVHTTGSGTSGVVGTLRPFTLFLSPG